MNIACMCEVLGHIVLLLANKTMIVTLYGFVAYVYTFVIQTLC